MKQIIDGRRYDTDAAEEIASHTEAHPGDFRWQDETLYKTTKEVYFLAGTGGPMTRYAEVVPTGGKSGGHGIFPLSDKEAMATLEAWGNTAALEEHFADSIEDA